ncbi:MAG: hypothetical protein IJP91_04700, partial [Synergistaceae bacterium]|nr:hypothetical protein [Synergistaceae bacterium]
MKKIIAAALLMMILCASSACAAGLSLEECLNTALANHPSLKKSKGATRAANSMIEQTKTTNRVKVNLTGRTSFAGDYQTWDSRSTSQTFGI